MTEGKLTKLLKKGYPYLKDSAGLPAWLLPERSFEKVVDEVGDGAILEIAQPLNLAFGISQQPGDLPDPESVPADTWRKSCRCWLPLISVKPVVSACLQACDTILRERSGGETNINREAVYRGMAVLCCAPFVPQGRPLVEELAIILHVDPGKPADLITRYAQAVLTGDLETVAKVDAGISEYPQWLALFAEFEKHTAAVSSNPRLVGITPPISERLTAVLTTMIKEGVNNGA